METTYSLNLSPKYVPDWGPWEVAREIICNAIDADPHGFHVDTSNRDCLVVTTDTVPEIGELFVIGGGSKVAGGDTIGQFGEGMKMAALVALRDGEGMTIDIPGKRIDFYFEFFHGEKVIHAKIREHVVPSSGTTITIRMPGISNATAGRILFNVPTGPMNKLPKSPLTIFCKNVYINTFSDTAIWDWNLDNLAINRDRAMVSSDQVVLSIANWLKNATDAQLEQILLNKDSIEAKAVYNASAVVQSRLLSLVTARHGTNICASSGAREDEAAKRKGYKVVNYGDYLNHALMSAGLQASVHIKEDEGDWEPADATSYNDQIEAVKKVFEAANVVLPALRVFTADIERDAFSVTADMTIWLHKTVFEKSRAELLGLVAWEVARLDSAKRDVSAHIAYRNLCGTLLESVAKTLEENGKI